MTELEKADIQQLMDLPSFRRWSFKLMLRSGIWDATANGSDGRNLFLEGRRSLGLETLREVESALPVQHPSGIPMLTLLRLLTEEIQTPTEKPNGRRTRDQYRDLDDGDDGSASE